MAFPGSSSVLDKISVCEKHNVARVEEKDIGVLLFSVRQRFGLRAKNSRAKKSTRKSMEYSEMRKPLVFGMRAQNAAF